MEWAEICGPFGGLILTHAQISWKQTLQVDIGKHKNNMAGFVPPNMFEGSISSFLFSGMLVPSIILKGATIQIRGESHPETGNLLVQWHPSAKSLLFDSR